MIAVIDYGAGNIQSVVKALKFIGCDCIVTNKKEELLKADGAIMPGVGFWRFYGFNDKDRS